MQTMWSMKVNVEVVGYKTETLSVKEKFNEHILAFDLCKPLSTPVPQ